eukprot:TRINITY_DN95386_c0_g1_i1.p1 TRINITY_DN95386_c0_g1~~TRINITY_DN95386_c0_g1_i1.p1  ORF type:complete len:333 (-),score=62.01 TRINITY_DN95386_c0_g1_i1:163-1038(-)
MTYIAEVAKKTDEKAPPAEEEGEDEIYDQAPARVICPHCGLKIITFIEHEASWVTYAVILGLLLVLGWAALLVVPIVYPLFKDVVHHCPRCLSRLAAKSRVVLPSLRNEVMSFRFGSCVVVLARKYVMMLVVLFSVIGVIHVVRSSTGPRTGLDAVERGEMSPYTWLDFRKDCGFQSYLGNPIHVTMAFEKKYKNRTFAWSGSVHHIEDGFNFLWLNAKGTLFLRMDPPQIANKRHLADIALMFDEGTSVGKEVSTLKGGANVSFTATMVEVGKRGSPHTMVAWELQKNKS